jgi:gamma-glutamylputrescine oxidase
MHMSPTDDFNLSYWEIKQFFRLYDLIVVGSGIVGLSTAISFKEKKKNAKVLIVEKGLLPDGASSKNAGFACFGSPGELLSDLESMSDETVWETVQMRWDGLMMLRKRLGDKGMDYRAYGGYELFREKISYEKTAEKLGELNKAVHAITKKKSTYSIIRAEKLPLKGIKGAFFNRLEGQIDTALMMQNLLTLASQLGITILNNVQVKTIFEKQHFVHLETNLGVFTSKKTVIATNGFASGLLNLKDVKPARAQVLVTEPLPGLKIRGSFHFDKGYYYFRNIDKRILLGGGRNLDFTGETTTEPGISRIIQDSLEKHLRDMILPDKDFKIERRWSGIMGVGLEKKPIIKHVSANVIAAVRMGGMGVAIGSLVGFQAAKKALLK